MKNYRIFLVILQILMNSNICKEKIDPWEFEYEMENLSNKIINLKIKYLPELAESPVSTHILIHVVYSYILEKKSFFFQYT